VTLAWALLNALPVILLAAAVIVMAHAQRREARRRLEMVRELRAKFPWLNRPSE
jgi:hypothetical protein